MHSQSTLLPCRLCRVVDCNHRRVARAKAYDTEHGAFISRACNQCRNDYLARVRTLRIGMGLYCSKSCSNASRRIPEAQRFWALVDKRGPDECWPWLAAVDPNGYGIFSRDDRSQIGAHRLALIYAIGPLGDGIQACHHCDNPPCCNQTHLFPGTAKENHEDAARKGRKRHGGQHYFAKLSDDAIRDIRRRHAGGETQTALGLEYGVTQAAVWAIVTRKTWRTVQ